MFLYLMAILNASELQQYRNAAQPQPHQKEMLQGLSSYYKCSEVRCIWAAVSVCCIVTCCTVICWVVLSVLSSSKSFLSKLLLLICSMSLLRWSAGDDSWEESVSTWSWFGWRVLRWVLTWPDWLNLCRQRGQLYGLAPVWMSWCLCRLNLEVKNLWQCSHSSRRLMVPWASDPPSLLIRQPCTSRMVFSVPPLLMLLDMTRELLVALGEEEELGKCSELFAVKFVMSKQCASSSEPCERIDISRKNLAKFENLIVSV